MSKSKKAKNKRAVVSIALFVSMFMVLVTSLLTHVTHGFSISHLWLHVHVLFGLLFMVFGILHIVYNWKVFRNYIAGKSR